MRVSLVSIALTLFSVVASAADLPMARGAIILIDKCPGDKQTTASPSGNEGFFAALLTPLLTGIVSHGIKSIGTKLQEAAQEAQVDALANGDYFYSPDGDGAEIGLKNRCVIVVTKSTRQTKRTLADLTKLYTPAELVRDGKRDSIKSWLSPDNKALLDELAKAGYKDIDSQGKIVSSSKPGLIAVFDVELSLQQNAARLVPRFIVMDHSIREKADDTRARDMTLEVTFTAPSVGDAFGKEVFKFEGLKINSPRVRKATDPGPETLSEVGQWFALPAIGEELKGRVSGYKAAKAAIETELTAARFAKAAAEKLGATGLITDCPAPTTIAKPWAEANAQLVLEQAKPKESQDTKAVARLVQVTTYYGACQRMRDAENKRDETTLAKKDAFVPFDMAINVKEFRERPAAKFFGGVLADDDVRKGMTSAIINAVDPATREAAAKEKAKTQLALKGSYETALYEAEKARVAYDGAKDEEKAAKYLEMEYKKRAANRIADDMELPRPYPDSGIWFTG